jgi:hypothetical protein
MIEVSTDQLKQAVKSQHVGTATFVPSVPVCEQFRGEPALSGNVAIFDLKNSPSGASSAYAWDQDRPYAKKRYAAVLRLGNITGPMEAVRLL